MGLLDDAKRNLTRLRAQAGKLAGDHGDKADGAIDKVAGLVERRAGARHHDRIESAAGKAKDLVQRLSAEEGGTDAPTEGSARGDGKADDDTVEIDDEADGPGANP